ncbi:MspA family porin [Nocardia miyunensis]|uniref:MspA family porin n=1 Tax=Nocardia miyunensis TaxID=282684 RepID=UPI00082F1508|nr:MspA family porin [Nocardia miyunensis]
MLKIHKGTLARLAGIGVAAGTAIGYFSVGAASADTFVPLPGGSVTQTLGDGTVVTVSINGESAKISPSMGATPLHRNVWTSAHGEINLRGGQAGSKDTYTKLRPGYIVACQVDISSVTPGGDASGSTDLTADSPSLSTSADASGDLSLSAGQAKIRYLLDLESPDDYGAESHSARHKVVGPHNGVTWTDETFSVNGCAGYAQARSFVEAAVYTGHTVGYVTVWGKPFSIG